MGADFEKAVDAAFDILEQEVAPLTNVPGIAASRGVKRLLLRRFPYAIMIQQRGTETFVVAVAHQARRPGYWRDRLRT